MVWAKGQSGNPAGQAFLPPDLRNLKKLSSRLAVQLLTKCLFMPLDDLKAKMSDPDATSLELMLCRTISLAIEKGDHKIIDFFFDRLIGKVTDKVEHKLPAPTVIKLRNEDASLIIGRMKEEEE